METILFYILGVVVIGVGLVLSIALHEVGHLVPAKLFNVKVTQYMIGFGRTIWSRQKGETEYGFKLIPLGGYISMIGMFPPEKTTGRVRASSTGFFQSASENARLASAATIAPGDEDRAFYRLPIWKRVTIMLGGPSMNLLLAFLFYAILISGIGLPQTTTTLASVSECVLPATSDRQTCEATDEPSPGSAAGLLPGDTITGISGTPIATWDELTDVIQPAAGQTLVFEVERDGESLSLPVTPLLTQRYLYDEQSGEVLTDTEGNSPTQDVGFVGIGPASEMVPQSITAVGPAVGENVVLVGHMILNLPDRMVKVAQAAFTSEPREQDSPISIVGVGRVAGEIAAHDGFTVQSKIATFVGLLASINVALFMFNLVPLMPLDGGHVAGALWEGIRRRGAKLFGKPDPGPFDAASLMPLTMAVAVVLLIMTVLLIYADLVNPISLFSS